MRVIYNTDNYDRKDMPNTGMIEEVVHRSLNDVSCNGMAFTVHTGISPSAFTHMPCHARTGYYNHGKSPWIAASIHSTVSRRESDAAFLKLLTDPEESPFRDLLKSDNVLLVLDKKSKIPTAIVFEDLNNPNSGVHPHLLGNLLIMHRACYQWKRSPGFVALIERGFTPREALVLSQMYYYESAPQFILYTTDSPFSWDTSVSTKRVINQSPVPIDRPKNGVEVNPAHSNYIWTDKNIPSKDSFWKKLQSKVSRTMTQFNAFRGYTDALGILDNVPPAKGAVELFKEALNTDNADLEFPFLVKRGTKVA